MFPRPYTKTPTGRVSLHQFIPDGLGLDDALPVVWHDGTPRVLAVLPPTPDFGGLPKYSAANPVIPRSEWKSLSFGGYKAPVLNQGSHGSCVGHAAVTAFWRMWMMCNYTVPPSGFSACWTYSLINGGWDRGAVISSAMTSLMTDGVALLSQVPEGMIYQRQIPNFATAKSTAQKYKVKAAYHCESFDEIVSAILSGKMTVFAVRAGGSWDVDANGIPPVLRGTGNHAQHGFGLEISPSGEPLILNQNSWGESWGQGGFCHYREAHLDCGSQDSFAIEFDTPDPGNPHLPPGA